MEKIWIVSVTSLVLGICLILQARPIQMSQANSETSAHALVRRATTPTQQDITLADLWPAPFAIDSQTAQTLFEIWLQEARHLSQEQMRVKSQLRDRDQWPSELYAINRDQETRQGAFKRGIELSSGQEPSLQAADLLASFAPSQTDWLTIIANNDNTKNKKSLVKLVRDGPRAVAGGGGGGASGSATGSARSQIMIANWLDYPWSRPFAPARGRR